MEQVEVKVGMGATEVLWTDSHAYTVQKVISPKRVIVTRDKVRRIDSNGFSDFQEYEYTPVPLNETNGVEIRLYKNGWKRPNGSRFIVGRKVEYFDYSF